ncbi:MAG: carboxypeptidase-like regulatory domain-containing protein, partial [Pedobacter sp.]|nr:carboxypeptidase-like regulatory domain-containing protein [Chitinophagaceae bacterium]
MRQALLFIAFIIPNFLWAGTISGSVTDAKGNLLPYSSILIKGSAKGTTANAKGFYSFVLGDGKYTLVCQRVGFKTIEKTVVISGDAVVDFVLLDQQYQLQEVVVKNGAEDPAYAIIRKAIKKRPDYENEHQKFECQVYIKGQIQLRDYPKKFMGDKVDFEDGDTSKRKIIFLSETVAKYSKDGKDRKIEVLSTKVSGNSNGFGFASPSIISLYSNIVPLGRGLNPRGFISPIAKNALNFYKYHFEGTFYENGKEISRIKVIPKRKYEPLFSG